MKASSFLKNLKKDIPAGIVVFLVALPLCLGIALASGAPLFSGIVSGIIGGIVVGALSGSQLSVSGPAAGLTVIIMDAIQQLPTFEVFLSAVVLAGVIQLVLGFLRAGFIGYYFPSNVIKGMLAAIGILLIFKQLPYLIGSESGFIKGLIAQGLSIESIEIAFSNMHLGAIITGLSSIAIIVVWGNEKLQKISFFKNIPGALVAVVMAVVMNALFKYFVPSLAMSNDLLVRLPSIRSKDEALNALVFPDFSMMLDKNVLLIAFTIAIVASIESLLSLEAIDKIDPDKRVSPPSRELKAQGVGNILAGLVGGLPMTSVIVRSSANLTAGAKTKSSAIVHGIMLVLAIVFLAEIINRIPYSALAAILIVVGFKLTTPKLILEMKKLGNEQFIPFAVTIVAILFTDLLVGIGIGMAVGIFFILRLNYKLPYRLISDSGDGKTIPNKSTFILSEHVSFLNKAALQKALMEVQENTHVVIDGSNAIKIDFDALEVIHDFKISAVNRGITLQIIQVRGLEILDEVKRSGH